MRVLLFTGKGGVGKTTLAAATAAAAAAAGIKTLVLSTDPAHSLGDVVGRALPAGEVVEVDDGLFALHVDVRGRLDMAWGSLRDTVLRLLDSVAVDAVEAEEITVLPGAEEVLALLEVRDQARSGRFGLLVVDCAPTAETVRLLALPEALERYLRRLWPLEGRVLRTLRPALGRAMLGADPGQLLADLDRLQTELADVRSLLRDEGTTIRLVLTPEAVVVAEARRTLTTLALFGYRVDAAIANRLVPPGADPWRSALAAAQAQQLAQVAADFAPLPVLSVPYETVEPVGMDSLKTLGQSLYGDLDPIAELSVVPVSRVEQTDDGYALILPVPLAERATVELERIGDDLVVGVGGQRRIVGLVSALRRCRVVGASLAGGELTVRFVPDPALWPNVNRRQG
ncbi:MAG: ArsA family ATPase [Actinomycetota bacterium]|nr:MAG: ArsA family ATPase [Actinomycetota bacterium]